MSFGKWILFMYLNFEDMVKGMYLFFRFIWGILFIGEIVNYVIQYLIECFVIMGVFIIIKINNGLD